MGHKHTPGPWKYETYRRRALIRSGNGWVSRGTGDGYDIARIAAGEHAVSSVAEEEANARLIAAAPEMLEALQAISSGTWNKTDEHSQELNDALKRGDKTGFRYAFMSWAQKRARAAVAKAEGRDA